MNMRVTPALLGKALFLFMAVCAVLAQAQPGGVPAYPTKPVRIVVGFAPGGGTDIVGRIIAQKLSEATGQSFFVDNRPGASATIASGLVAKAVPDGYTLIIGIPTSHSVLPVLMSKLSYDAIRDFEPIAMVAQVPLLLVVHPSLPVRTVANLITLAKARPGQLSFGNGGIGTPPHMAGELFKQMAGVDLLHVPYKGEAPAITEVIGGQISLIFSGIAAVLPHVQAGRLRGIAVTGTERVATLPEYPTVADSGLPGFSVDAWYGLLGPAGMPKEIVAKLNRELVRMLDLPDVRERLATQGLFVKTSTPEQLGSYMKLEIEKWAKVVKNAGLKLD